MLTELWFVLLSTVLVNNFVLTKFLGLCPFMGVSNRLDSALGMSLATAFVLTLSAGLAYLIEAYLLAPLGLAYLRTLSFILVIGASVQLTEIILRKTSPLLYRVLGLFLPLITSNCAVLGVALLVSQRYDSLLESLAFGFGAASGFALVLICFSALRERIQVADVPAAFQGAPIALMTAGLMSLAFMGFTSLAGL
jgi:electron transport complex protein RnfA